MAIAIFGLQVADEFLHVVDVVVEPEGAVGQGHGAGVFPVGDVDLVVLQHGLHGIAQQRGVVARQRCHDQDSRLALKLGQRGRVVRETLETAQFAKRLVKFHPLMDSHAGAFHIDGLNAKGWLFVVFTQAVQQAVAGGHALGERIFAKRRQGVAVDLCSCLRKVNKGLHQGALGFIDFIKHGSTWVL